MKKTFSLSVLLALLAVLLSACGLVSSVSIAPEYLATATAEPEPTASPTQPASTATPLPNDAGSLEIVEGVFRPAAEGESLSVFPGEVVNRSDVALGFIQVTFTFINEAGEVIYEGRAYADVPYVEAGKAAPYEYILDSQDLPEGETWSSYEVSVTAEPRQTYSGVSITDMTVEQEGNYYEISGTFSNIGSGICELPLVVVVGYNDADQVLLSRRIPPMDENSDVVATIGSAESVPFLAVFDGTEVANLRVIAVCEK